MVVGYNWTQGKNVNRRRRAVARHVVSASIHFERLIFLIGSSLFIVLMAPGACGARPGFAAASVDSLTGVANRSAFLLARPAHSTSGAHESVTPVSRSPFDLDHFRPSTTATATASATRCCASSPTRRFAILRPADWLAASGGEEFLAILPGAGIDVAVLIADRVRHAFAPTPRHLRRRRRAPYRQRRRRLCNRHGRPRTLLEQAESRALPAAKGSAATGVERAVDLAPPIGDSRVGSWSRGTHAQARIITR